MILRIRSNHWNEITIYQTKSQRGVLSTADIVFYSGVLVHPHPPFSHSIYSIDLFKMAPKYSAIIFDIGDVLFTWSKFTTTTISAQTIKLVIDHPIWCEFERGEIPAATCYRRLADASSISSGQEVAEAFEQARNSLSQDPLMTELLHQIRQEKGIATETNADKLALYAMSNISKEDYAFLRGLDAPWHLFDEVFASGYAGMRKPEARFYEFVLREIGLQERAGEAIFVDDKWENVEAAREAGLHAVQFKSAAETGAELRRLLALQSR